MYLESKNLISRIKLSKESYLNLSKWFSSWGDSLIELYANDRYVSPWSTLVEPQLAGGMLVRRVWPT